MKTNVAFLIVVMLSLGTFKLRAQQQAVVPAWKDEVSQIRSLLKTHPDQAADQIDDLLKGKNKKDVALLTALGDAYLSVGNYTDAASYAVKGQKVNSKAPETYVLQGDIALAQKNIGEACQLYEQAIYFDPDCVEAYLKYAEVYKTASPSQAIAKLDALKQRQPNCLAADKALADVYYSSNHFEKAAKAYGRFINTSEATASDWVRYAFALFFDHEFAKSLDIAKQALQKNPRDAVFNRIVMYNYVDMKQYDAARDAADKFFLHSDSAHYSHLDSLYCSSMWKGLSGQYEAKNDYPQAISAYETYFRMLSPKEQTPEVLLQLGRLYYGEGTTADSVNISATMRNHALLQGDTIFARLQQEAPKSYLGDFWRARVNSALDPETTQGRAKPYYEAVVNMLTASNDAGHNSVLVECYSYLGYYYLVNNNVDSSTDYWNKILTIDPNNVVAKRALAGIEKMKSKRGKH